MTELTSYEQKTIEANAAAFAAVTHRANDLAKLMSQSFEIRIKSGLDKDAFFDLFCCTIDTENLGKILGKRFNVKVAWSATNQFHLDDADTGKRLFLFTEEDFKLLVTQVGMVKKMFNVWNLVSENSK